MEVELGVYMFICESFYGIGDWREEKELAVGWVLGIVFLCCYILVWSFREVKNFIFELDFLVLCCFRNLKGSEIGVFVGGGCLAWSGRGEERFLV